MKRLSRLIKVNDYLRTFTVPDHRGLIPIRVVDQGDATSRLSNATGEQVVIALPECTQRGGTDSYVDNIALAFFVLAKITGPARTQELADATFARLLDIANAIVERFCDDMSAGHCPLLNGLSLGSLNVMPEYSLFGGWSGWSVEITHEP